jgi:hypothetical protein
METFFEYVPLTLNHVQVIVRGLYAVATCDDVHQTEKVLIEGFYDACRQEVAGLADYADIIKSNLDPEQAKEILDTSPLRHTFLKTCLLLAFADGKYSTVEQAKIAEFAEMLQVDAATVADLKDQVTEYLFSQIATIENLDALREVSRELQR